MTADGRDGDGEKSRFRWLDAVRYAVAAAVTVLIMAVIVNAIKVVLRPESLQLSVSGGYVSAGPFETPPPAAVLTVGLNLRARNPSGRVRMYYLNISAYLFDNKTSAASLDPSFDCIFTFNPKDIAVVQREALDSSLVMKVKKTMAQMDESYFDTLYNGSSFSGMTLRLDGNLKTEVTSEYNKTSRTTYYCEQLLFGGNSDDEDLKINRQDVICKQRRGLN